MATLGSTAEPTTGQTWYGLNTTNHFAILVTMPAGGPWLITDIGFWCSGQSETADVKGCVWTSGGSLVAQTANEVVANRPFALGNNELVYAPLTTPYEVAGGAQVYIGFARDNDDNVQFGTRSGTRAQWYNASWPSSFGSWSNVSDAIGAYITYESANVAPAAPVSLSPTGNAVVNSGTAPTLSGTRSDPDGDNMTYVQIVVYADDGTTVRYDSGKVADTGTTFARAVSLPSAHAYYRWKARTWDSQGLVGPYSAQQRFYANGVPSTPAAPTVSSTSTLVPTFGGTFIDSGDTLAAIQIEVEPGAGGADKWLSGDIAKSGASGSAWTQAYGGSALAWATSYRARYRTKDSHGAYSSWGAWKTWSTTQPAGPDAMSPTSTNPRLFDLTPDLTVGHSALFQNHEIQVRTGPDGTGTLLWDLTWGTDYADVTSKVVTYAGTALALGGTYYWRARIELADTSITEWSEWYPFRINAVPNSPTGMSPTNGTVVADTLTPDLYATFSDPDVDQGDTPLNADIDVQRVSDSAVMWDLNASTGLNDGVITYAGSALSYDVEYRWRALFRDADGQAGPLSDWKVFKCSQSPSATVVAPADAAVVVESTPTLEWNFSSPGGKAQYSFRVRIYDLGPTGNLFPDRVEVYDSEERISAAETFDVPFGVLVNDRSYTWTVTIRDTDQLEYTLE